MADVTLACYSSYGREKGNPQKCMLPFSKQIVSLLLVRDMGHTYELE